MNKLDLDYQNLLKDMLKNKDISVTDKISLHIAEEAMWYILPTIGFQKMDWSQITEKEKRTYLFVIKWLKASIGVIIENN